ncbi:hypothetical protein TVAG_430700 [Trichomonas vaginalis G3]|uniref:Uncharacterized protein n=1 Tax=Trichomonas vaginalis (strain ATCC PRA-98 / G3) TaxID=412133 RepID=A2E395_TRIV3|nr:hypothetical protein TVAGG3_1017670 [Trichomonas vaginalis G3]EAY12905.1 hypothetical protein TVAG_430700 [Trichomonas vaginalis G3]KAI5491924.1 hypothetical protein TVAGG3_1017670 [Trichomonas vaginalis G3]|eukprot:XP_001325128.1 hypothetical protein [Trichomonas vaginalis G3]
MSSLVDLIKLLKSAIDKQIEELNRFKQAGYLSNIIDSTDWSKNKAKNIVDYFINQLESIKAETLNLSKWLSEQQDDSIVHPARYFSVLSQYDDFIVEAISINNGAPKGKKPDSFIPFTKVLENKHAKLPSVQDKNWQNNLPQIYLVAREFGKYSRDAKEPKEPEQTELLKFDEFIDGYSEYLNIVNNQIEIKRLARKVYLYYLKQRMQQKKPH